MQIQKVTIFVRKRVAKRFQTENSKVGFVQNETDNYDYHNVQRSTIFLSKKLRK